MRPAGSPDPRDETEAERDDRNLAELLQELRVAGLGVQVLFAFPLTAAAESPWWRAREKGHPPGPFGTNDFDPHGQGTCPPAPGTAVGSGRPRGVLDHF